MALHSRGSDCPLALMGQLKKGVTNHILCQTALSVFCRFVGLQTPIPARSPEHRIWGPADGGVGPSTGLARASDWTWPRVSGQVWGSQPPSGQEGSLQVPYSWGRCGHETDDRKAIYNLAVLFPIKPRH